MRVLLAETDRYYQEIIKQALENNKYIVDSVGDGDRAWNYLNRQTTQYTIVILNYFLPHLSGIELIEKIRQRDRHIPILLTSISNSLNDKVKGLDAGADDYLVQPFRIPELLARLRALYRRSPNPIQLQLKLENLILDYKASKAIIIGRESPICLDLTNKEFQLLEYFMQHPQQIITKERLLTQIWAGDKIPHSNVVAVQIRSLRQKLAAAKCQIFIETIYGLGYCLQTKNPI